MRDWFVMERLNHIIFLNLKIYSGHSGGQVDAELVVSELIAEPGIENKGTT